MKVVIAQRGVVQIDDGLDLVEIEIADGWMDDRSRDRAVLILSGLDSGMAVADAVASAWAALPPLSMN